jgi:heat shock protein HtpX
MLGTLAIIIGLSTLIFTVILMLLSSLDLMTLGILVVAFNIGQWLISPYIIDALYRTRELPENENPKLHEVVEDLSRKSGIQKPRLMVAQIPIPNAFAYGSPIAGNRVAVTSGLLKTLENDEVEAVIGHELGHLKHRDVQIMMFVSLLPALLTYIGYSLMLSTMYRGQKEGSSSGSALLGIGLMAFSWILNMFILYLSRLREYYADRHSTLIVDDGPRKLSEGLAKIVHETKNMKRIRKDTQHLSAFKALFIADPDHVETDSMAISTMTVSSDQKLVQEILSQKLTTMDRIVEIFSTHPNIIKRLKALRESS